MKSVHWATKTGDIIVLCERIEKHKAPLLWVGAFVMKKYSYGINRTEEMAKSKTYEEFVEKFKPKKTTEERERATTVWKISERERAIIAEMSAKNQVGKG